MSRAIQIVAVEGGAGLERFIRVPMRINAGDPNYIAPLMFERREALSPKQNPYFDHAEARFWLAVRGGVDVGRISAQVDAMAPPDARGPVGHFGNISAEDDPEIFAALFATAEAWLKERGCAQVYGPFNLSINEETGLLVDGFDTPPMVLMGHDPAYAGPRIEALGYEKAKDVFAYLTGPPTWSPAIRRRLDRPLAAGVVIRPVNMKRFDEEVRSLVEIHNDAWADNWGFIAVTPKETKHLAESLRLLLHPKFIWFMEFDGEPAAFGVLLPNLNDAIFDLKGKLLPFGWAKLIWRLKVKGVSRGRVPLMGVKRKFARDPRGIAAPFLIMENMLREGLKEGVNRCECSWILEDNKAMRHILEDLGARAYKTYRIYGKAI